MAWVHFANSTNSTLFTNCCDTAISDNQHNCPKCGTEIEHGSCEEDTHRMRWNFAMRRYKVRSK